MKCIKKCLIMLIILLGSIFSASLATAAAEDYITNNNQNNQIINQKTYYLWNSIKTDSSPLFNNLAAKADFSEFSKDIYKKLKEIFGGCTTEYQFYEKLLNYAQKAEDVSVLDSKSTDLKTLVNLITNKGKDKPRLFCHQLSILLAAGIKARFSGYDEEIGYYIDAEKYGEFEICFYRDYDRSSEIFWPWKSHVFLVVKKWNENMQESDSTIATSDTTIRSSSLIDDVSGNNGISDSNTIFDRDQINQTPSKGNNHIKELYILDPWMGEYGTAVKLSKDAVENSVLYTNKYCSLNSSSSNPSSNSLSSFSNSVMYSSYEIADNQDNNILGETSNTQVSLDYFLTNFISKATFNINIVNTIRQQNVIKDSRSTDIKSDNLEIIKNDIYSEIKVENNNIESTTSSSSSSIEENTESTLNSDDSVDKTITKDSSSIESDTTSTSSISDNDNSIESSTSNDEEITTSTITTDSKTKLKTTSVSLT